ncbi:MAG TPA: hypothetical protein VGH14_17745 [Solirubrobacterales bacterium]
MRKALLFPLLLCALGLAACGGGSGSSATTSGSGGTSPEAAWAKEVDKVMRDFENNVSAQAAEQIHTTSSQALVEPLYREYGAALTKLSGELEATAAPSACVALRKRMAADGRALGQLTTKLGHEAKVDQEEFSSLVVEQEARLHRYGSDLTEITAAPHC